MAIRILAHYRVTDPDVACVALLHDAVEDHAEGIAPGGDRQAALAVLAGRFGARTAGLVAAVTNPVWEPGRDEHEQYREYVLASLGGQPVGGWPRSAATATATAWPAAHPPPGPAPPSGPQAPAHRRKPAARPPMTRAGVVWSPMIAATT